MDGLMGKWNEEKAALERVTTRQLELEEARARLEAAQRSGEWSRAGELMHSTIPKLQRELEAAEQVRRVRGFVVPAWLWVAVAVAVWLGPWLGLWQGLWLKEEAGSAHLVCVRQYSCAPGQRRHQHAWQRRDTRHRR